MEGSCPVIREVCAECAKKIAAGDRYIFSTEPLIPIEERLYHVDEHLRSRTVRLTLLVEPATKKNSSQWFPFPGGRGGKLHPSKRYKRMQKGSAPYCPDLRIDYPVNMKATYYMPTRRDVDLVNLHSALHDILVHYHTVVNDNIKVIVSTDGSRVRYDRENPRVEVEITPAPEEDVLAVEAMTAPGRKKKKQE
jgi:Holliday junction resolvase RusA-like endonuclease